MNRFQRQIELKQVGKDGQEKLKNASIAIIGAGGLGTPAFSYLVSAGIGTIKIIDFDTIDISNLNRQFFYGIDDVGKKKVDVITAKLSKQYPDVKIIPCTEKVDSETIDCLIEKNIDCLVQCLDSFETRIIINDYALAHSIPIIEGGIEGFYGYVMGISKKTACMRCMGYHKDKKEQSIPVMGAVAGVIGSLQASSCINYLLGNNSIFNVMLQYDGILCEFDKIPLSKNPHCICNIS